MFSVFSVFLDEVDGELGEGDRPELLQPCQVDQARELSLAAWALVQLQPGDSSQECGKVLQVQHQLHVQALAVRQAGGDGESCGDVLVDWPGEGQGTSLCQHCGARPADSSHN